MNLLEADTKLRGVKHPFLSTRETASYLGVSTAYASTILRRLETAGRVACLGRGRWLIGEVFDPLGVVEQLTAPYPSYISLHSAFYHHGMIMQIPAVTYAVSLGRSKRLKTPVGDFSVHHVMPEFFFGFELIGKFGVKMASPEKALLDFLYLFPTRSRSFRALPELELPTDFDERSAWAMLERISSRSRRSIVRERLATILYNRTQHSSSER